MRIKIACERRKKDGWEERNCSSLLDYLGNITFLTFTSSGSNNYRYLEDQMLLMVQLQLTKGYPLINR